MSFPFSINVNIPAANNDPAADQPIMQQNTANIAGFLAVNHVPAGTNDSPNGAGFHKLITYSKKNSGDYVPPGAPTNPNSIGFTALSTNIAFNGVQSSGQITVPQQFFWSPNAVYSAIPIKAFGLLQLNQTNTPPTTLTILNGFNLNTLQATDAVGRNFTVRLFNNIVVEGNIVSVFFMPQNTTTPTLTNVQIESWSFANPVLSFRLTSGVASTFNMAVMILQV